MHYSEPVLLDLVTVLRAPAVVLSEGGGDLAGGAQGFFFRDRRRLRTMTVDIDGRRLTPVGRHEANTEVIFEGVDSVVNYRPMDGPSLHVVRRRVVRDGGFDDTITVSNRGLESCAVTLGVRADSDLAEMNIVRSGLTADLVAPTVDDFRVAWAVAGIVTELVADTPHDAAEIEGMAVRLCWNFVLAPQQSTGIKVAVDVRDRVLPGLVLDSGMGQVDLEIPGIPDRSARQTRLIERSIADLDALLLRDRRHPNDVFPAAGAPWYFTLFGRDSIWTSLLVHSVAPDLGRGTLRTLFRYQGRAVDPSSEEQPGRFPHEVRSAPVRVYGVLDLPPVYYGNIDTTALWVILAHTVTNSAVASDNLRDGVARALDWIAAYGDADGDQLVEYAGNAEGGLVHQAWKDSPTGITGADGTAPTGPIATAEVQGYAYAAAVAGAELFEAAGDRRADRWREWAHRLRARFHETFWIEDGRGPFPAMALDGRKRPVAGAASNMAHLLGTGLLDAEQARFVAMRLSQPDLDSGYGLRTLSSDVAAYSPLSYHRGSVWPHDTAIAIRGLLREGYPDQAKRFAEGIVRASEAFGGRLPELYGGNAADRDPVALTAYPTACAPQAWSAAAGLVAVGALEGWYA